MTVEQAEAEARYWIRLTTTGPWRRIRQAEALGRAPSKDDVSQHRRYIDQATAVLSTVPMS
jgi:hypothetical protein